MTDCYFLGGCTKSITLNFHGSTTASAPQARLGFGELTCCGGALSSRVSLRDGGRWSLAAVVGVEAELSGEEGAESGLVTGPMATIMAGEPGEGG